jgi:hypothetical protein
MRRAIRLSTLAVFLLILLAAALCETATYSAHAGRVSLDLSDRGVGLHVHGSSYWAVTARPWPHGGFGRANSDEECGE